MLELALTAVLFPMLAALCVIDLREHRLPDTLTLPLIALGLVLAVVGAGVAPRDAALGALAGFAVFWALGEVYYRRRGVDGLGLGDAKLLAAAGAWLGWRALPLLVLAAALGALAAALAARRSADRQIAFGPWLAAGFALLWLARIAEFRIG